jgi:hypothetical protein
MGYQQQPYQIEYDNKGQMERISAMLAPSEILYAVFDEKGRGSGYVGITDRRLIFMDERHLREKKLMISLPYSKITGIGAEDGGGTFFSSGYLLVVAGDREFDFEFSSKEKAKRAHDLIVWSMFQNEHGLIR